MLINISNMRNYYQTAEQNWVRAILGNLPQTIVQICSGRRTFQRNHPSLPDSRQRDLDCN
jgi:hypothetical protein